MFIRRYHLDYPKGYYEETISKNNTSLNFFNQQYGDNQCIGLQH